MRCPTLGPYQFERRLAAGGMAEVFVARRRGPHGFERRLALKRMLPELSQREDLVRMFVDEARLAARLEHPNIVQVFDFGEHEGEPFIAMELVEGSTVAQLLRAIASRRETVPLGAALYVATEVAAALAHAHGLRDERGAPMGVVHRDVSPANVLLDAHGRVKLADFGIARWNGAERGTSEGQVRGKVGYMSPEQVVGGSVGAASDVFTLSVVLAEMLLAEPLFGRGPDLDVMLRIRDADLSPLRRRAAQLPRDVVALLEAGLARVPARRPTAALLELALRELSARREGEQACARELARLLARLELTPRRGEEAAAREPGARPTILVDLDAAAAPTTETQRLLRRVSGGSATLYELQAPGAPVEGPLAFSEVVRRIVTGRLAPGTRVRAEGRGFEAASRLPELRRYLASALRPWAREQAGSGAQRELVPGEPAQGHPAQGHPAQGHPAQGHPAQGQPAQGQPAQGHPAQGRPTRGSLDGAGLLPAAYRLVAGQETGALHLSSEGREKRLYFVEGRLERVASTLDDELLGEWLVARGTLLRMELDMALAVMSRFDGSLGETLVGLGMLRPLELFRALSERSRARYLEAFRWTSGCWRYEPGVRSGEAPEPRSFDDHELLRDAASQADARRTARALAPVRHRVVRAHPGPTLPAEVYRLPAPWLRLISAAQEGEATAQELLELGRSRHGLTTESAGRALYFALSCGLVEAA